MKKLIFISLVSFSFSCSTDEILLSQSVVNCEEIIRRPINKSGLVTGIECYELWHSNNSNNDLEYVGWEVELSN
jgi:hypothetical protein